MTWKDINLEDLSPMMAHYLSIKHQYPDCLIMYRLGDFYELFFDDAKLGSKVLELALTGRECGLDERAPMCGVPHQSIDAYASKLVEAGYKVAIVDQMEDASQAEGLVKRSVTQVITPGTMTDTESLEKSDNNFLLALYFYGDSCGVACADISTGEFYAGRLDEGSPGQQLDNLLELFQPSEVLLVGGKDNSQVLDEVRQRLEGEKAFFSSVDASTGNLPDLEGRLASYLPGRLPKPMRGDLVVYLACLGLLDYVYAFREEPLDHINQVKWLDLEDRMGMNRTSRENLELVYNLADRTKKGSLLNVLDRTQTAMGSRMMKQWLEMPLLDPEAINQRLDAVGYFKDHLALRKKIREDLTKIYDLERLLGKISFGRGNGRDLKSLAFSLAPIPGIKKSLGEESFPPIQNLNDNLDALEDLTQLIEEAIVDDPPILLTEGGLIKDGFSQDLDELKSDGKRASKELLEYEEALREETGIKKLRIIYRKNTGYFIEVTNSFLDQVPSSFIRRQTLKNAERFTTEKLQALAGRLTGNESQIFQLEYDLFQKVRQYVSDQTLRLQQTAKTIARLDVLTSLADLASDNNYCRPVFHEGDWISIKDGRHPVVELFEKNNFIPNDLEIGSKDNRIQVITGPNMAGKSTYMRQNALILIMAQMGSFVPASSCELPITDQIFTRIGASDRLSRGESTFMVEMKEMADILAYATKRSFLVLDEVGRGTGTNDGLAIAESIISYLAREVKAKTLFATHFHELTRLEDPKKGIRNRKVDILEEGGELVFLRKVVEGKADKSYGIEVAKMSGLPESVLLQAMATLEALDREEKTQGVDRRKNQPLEQASFASLEKDALIQSLADLDVNQLSPLDALNKLSKLVEEAKRMMGGGSLDD